MKIEYDNYTLQAMYELGWRKNESNNTWQRLVPVSISDHMLYIIIKSEATPIGKISQLTSSMVGFDLTHVDRMVLENVNLLEKEKNLRVQVRSLENKIYKLQQEIKTLTATQEADSE